MTLQVLLLTLPVSFSSPSPPEPGPGFARQPNLNVCFKRGTSSLFFVKIEDREREKLLFCVIKGGQVVFSFTEP